VGEPPLRGLYNVTLHLHQSVIISFVKKPPPDPREYLWQPLALTGRLVGAKIPAVGSNIFCLTMKTAFVQHVSAVTMVQRGASGSIMGLHKALFWLVLLASTQAGMAGSLRANGSADAQGGELSQ
jgi:hypothetical protein